MHAFTNAIAADYLGCINFCTRLFIVFCSIDLIREERHPVHAKVNAPEGSQILINVFDWASLQNDSFDSRFDLKKVVLRLYKDGNFTKQCAKATLQSQVFYTHARGKTELTGVVHHVNMSNGRYWEQLDLTEQFKSLWPIPKGGKEVFVTITLKSQCENNRLPIKLYDLKSISKLIYRRKLYSNQPVLSLYLNNDTIEKLARNAAGHLHPIPGNEVLESVEVKNQRRKRHVSSNECRKVDHLVSFEELGIPYVLLPVEYNAGKCVGMCNTHFITQVHEKEASYRVNNYAKLMAAQAHRRNRPEVAVCCNPGEYAPLMLLISTADGSSVRQKLYHEMRVQECYCR